MILADIYLGGGFRGAELLRQLSPGDGVLGRLLVVQPRVLRLDSGQPVADGLREDIGEQLALLRLPTPVLELQHCRQRDIDYRAEAQTGKSS